MEVGGDSLFKRKFLGKGGMAMDRLEEFFHICFYGELWFVNELKLNRELGFVD